MDIIYESDVDIIHVSQMWILFMCVMRILFMCLPRDELPYRLTLPVAILHARSSRELASLAMLGQGGNLRLAPFMYCVYIY